MTLMNYLFLYFMITIISKLSILPNKYIIKQKNHNLNKMNYVDMLTNNNQYLFSKIIELYVIETSFRSNLWSIMTINKIILPSSIKKDGLHIFTCAISCPLFD